MNEISPPLGREQEIVALGPTWRLARRERAVWGELLAWARERIPDPVDRIMKHIDKLPEALAARVVQETLVASQRFLSINSPEVGSILQSLEGSVRVLWLLLRDHQADATEDDAYRLAMTLGKDGMGRLFDVALGKSPVGNAGAPDSAALSGANGNSSSSAASSRRRPSLSPGKTSTGH